MSQRMPLIAALEVVRDLRRDQVVVSNMGTAREWPKLSSHPLDFHFVPSAMGHSPVLGLGIALAQAKREVIAFSGDGGLLMSLGCLVTIAAAGAANLTVIVVDNGRYEVTGGQRTAAASVALDWVLLARGCGMPTAVEFRDLETWRVQAASVFELPGPRLIAWKVEPVSDYQLESPGPMAERIAKFRSSLAPPPSGSR